MIDQADVTQAGYDLAYRMYDVSSRLRAEVRSTLRWLRSVEGPIYRAWSDGLFERGTFATVLKRLDSPLSLDEIVNGGWSPYDQRPVRRLVARYRALRRAVAEEVL